MRGHGGATIVDRRGRLPVLGGVLACWFVLVHALGTQEASAVPDFRPANAPIEPPKG
jgi:hypothetical protein